MAKDMGFLCFPYPSLDNTGLELTVIPLHLVLGASSANGFKIWFFVNVSYCSVYEFVMKHFYSF
jgi:hypothetical protein